MATVRINFAAVLGESSRCNNAYNKVSTARHYVVSNANALDYRIKQRANVPNRVNNISRNLNDINSRIVAIQRVCNDGATRYRNVDNNLKNQANAIKDNITLKSKNSKSRNLFK